MTAVTVLGVDEGDVEAIGVDELGEVEHGGYVSLCWEWDAHCMGLLCLCLNLGTHYFLLLRLMEHAIHMVIFIESP